MKRNLFIYACTLLVGMILYSCGAEDTELKKKIEMELAPTQPSVEVSVLNGIVTLTGTVMSEEAKAQAAEITKNTKYVKSVNNKIFVRTEEKKVEETPDQALTTTVKEGLNNQGFSEIGVDVKNGEVTLTGEVKKADLAKIMQIVNDSKPQKVINELKVK